MSLFGVPSGAQDRKVDGTLTLSQGSVAAGIGYSWRKGTLTYRGKTFPVEVQGLSAGEVGVIRADAGGAVYNLARLEDFDGHYTATTMIGINGNGRGVTALKNQHGVLIEMASLTQGISLKVAAGGIRLSIGE
jgi:hypothetical protein